VLAVPDSGRDARRDNERHVRKVAEYGKWGWWAVGNSLRAITPTPAFSRRCRSTFLTQRKELLNELFESKGIGRFPSHGWACTDANMSTYERRNVGPLGEQRTLSPLLTLRPRSTLQPTSLFLDNKAWSFQLCDPLSEPYRRRAFIGYDMDACNILIRILWVQKRLTRLAMLYHPHACLRTIYFKHFRRLQQLRELLRSSRLGTAWFCKDFHSAQQWQHPQYLAPQVISERGIFTMTSFVQPRKWMSCVEAREMEVKMFWCRCRAKPK